MKRHILFVCTINRMRSLTASTIYADDDRFEVLSAGTDKHANRVISEALLDWADYIIVMERVHRNHIRAKFPQIYQRKRIICLYIPDEFDYMQPELVILLRERFELIYQNEIEIRQKVVQNERIAKR